MDREVLECRRDLTMTELLLDARGLSRSFRRAGVDVHAVRNVSLEMMAGECCALVGRSGCGKSTLARLLLALAAPDAGSVRFRGVDLAALGGAELRAMRRHFQPVFQDAKGGLNPRHRVGEAIAEGMIVHGLAPDDLPAAVEERLIEVGLDPSLARSFPSQLSGGQAQRVALARALATEPELLVCDESFSGLDPSTQLQVMDLIDGIRHRRRMAVLLISHDIGLVRRMADRMMVMARGEIVEQGPADAVVRNPATPDTLQLLAAAPGWLPPR